MKALKAFILSSFLLLSLCGLNWFFVPSGVTVWTPATLTTKQWWYRSDTRVLSGSDLTTWNQLSADGGATGINLVFTSAWPQLVAAAINGHDAFQFPAGTVKGSTSPNPSTIIDPSSAFSFAYVHKSPVLGSGTFYALWTLAGSNAANSATLFYTNLTALPVFYFQLGNGTVALVSVPDFTISNYHYVIVSYNGGGSYGTAGNWAIYVNGVSQTVSSVSTSGGNTATNTIGDGSGGGASNAGNHVEEFFATQALTGADLTGAVTYFSTRYGL